MTMLCGNSPPKRKDRKQTTEANSFTVNHVIAGLDDKRHHSVSLSPC